MELRGRHYSATRIFFNNWRPYNGFLHGKSSVALPAVSTSHRLLAGFPAPTASATFNSNFGGCDGFSPDHYRQLLHRQRRRILATTSWRSWKPASLSPPFPASPTPPCATDCGYEEVTVTLSNALPPGNMSMCVSAPMGLTPPVLSLSISAVFRHGYHSLQRTPPWLTTSTLLPPVDPVHQCCQHLR